MKIVQIDPNVVSIDDLVIDFNSITHSKSILEKVYNFKEKQKLAVTTTATMLEYAKNKLHTIELAYDRLLALPQLPSLDEFPETVTIFCNLGDDVNPIYVEYDIPTDRVITALTRNPNFSLTDDRLCDIVEKYLEKN